MAEDEDPADPQGGMAPEPSTRQRKPLTPEELEARWVPLPPGTDSEGNIHLEIERLELEIKYGARPGVPESYQQARAWRAAEIELANRKEREKLSLLERWSTDMAAVGPAISAAGAREVRQNRSPAYEWTPNEKDYLEAQVQSTMAQNPHLSRSQAVAIVASKTPGKYATSAKKAGQPISAKRLGDMLREHARVRHGGLIT